MQSRSAFQNLEGTVCMAKLGKGMLFSVEQTFLGRDKIRAPLKMPALKSSSKGSLLLIPQKRQDALVMSRRLFSGSKVTDKTIRMLTKKLMCYFHTGGKHKQGRLPNLRLCFQTLFMIPK